MCLAQFSQYECINAYRIIAETNDEETFPSLGMSLLITQSFHSEIQLVFFPLPGVNPKRPQCDETVRSHRAQMASSNH